jgi:hypothetical protein
VGTVVGHVAGVGFACSLVSVEGAGFIVVVAVSVEFDFFGVLLLFGVIAGVLLVGAGAFGCAGLFYGGGGD